MGAVFDILACIEQFLRGDPKRVFFLIKKHGAGRSFRGRPWNLLGSTARKDALFEIISDLFKEEEFA